MDDGDGSAAAFEAAAGLNPRNFVNGAHDIFDDIHHDAFQFARQLRPLLISPLSPPRSCLTSPHSPLAG
jgi:hypothetical protein